MHVNEYVEQVHDQMRAAAALGDERTQQIAATLAQAADASVRLALLAAVSTAAAEITATLLETNGGPAITVAVDGDELRIDLAQAPQPAAPEPPPADEGDATARISLRLSERLKSEIDEAAGRDGVSVNTWLVRAAGAALAAPGGPGGPGWGGTPGWGGGPGWGGNWGGGSHGRGSNRVTGWVTG